MKLRLAALSLLLFFATNVAAAPVACPFSYWKASFKGSPTVQATCLLRPVLQFANLGAQQPLPEFLQNHVGKRIAISAAQLRRYLADENISEADLGGPVDKPLSRAAMRIGAPAARYFVIHDTSYPNYLAEPIPDNINEASWDFNDFTLHNPNAGNGPKAHSYVNRLGVSLTVNEFSVPQYATKLEKAQPALTGLFLHIELVQPRNSVPSAGKGNDGAAPQPGYSQAQYQRLALLYISASVRKGEWLVPAFHAVIDTGYVNGHDDPQNFLISIWNKKILDVFDSVKQVN